MPSLSESLINQNDIPEGAVTLPTQTAMPSPQQVQQPLSFNSFQRCPLPPIWNSNPDSVRQFYTNGVPQYRIFS